MDFPLEAGVADRLRAGDPAAAEWLVAAFHRPVYRFLICRGLDTSLAEELTAETFFQLIQSFANFRGNDHQVRAFVYATTRNVHSRYRRKTNRVESSNDATDSAIALDDCPLQKILAKERGQQLADAVAQLSAAAKEVVLLRFVEDLSIHEIALACELPTGTVKSHLHRAKQELRRTLTRPEDQP
ncbi:MAG: RNA polymerase sigma factor [Rubripirellula sp.]